MALFAIASSKPTFAATQTQPIDVSANVPRVCNLSSTAPSVVEYDPIGANLTSDVRTLLGTITITCNTAKTATFNPDHGLHGVVSGAYYQNRLYEYSNNQYLNYAIYQDANYSTVFGTTSTSSGSSGGASKSVAVVAGTPQSINVYMDIPAGQNESAGNYTDQIDVTVTY